MNGLTLDETGDKSLARLWLRGGFPRAYPARDEARLYGVECDAPTRRRADAPTRRA